MVQIILPKVRKHTLSRAESPYLSLKQYTGRLKKAAYFVKHGREQDLKLTESISFHTIRLCSDVKKRLNRICYIKFTCVRFISKYRLTFYWFVSTHIVDSDKFSD